MLCHNIIIPVLHSQNYLLLLAIFYYAIIILILYSSHHSWKYEYILLSEHCASKVSIISELREMFQNHYHLHNNQKKKNIFCLVCGSLSLSQKKLTASSKYSRRGTRKLWLDLAMSEGLGSRIG